MPTPLLLLRSRLPLPVLIAAVLLGPAAAHADMIIFKDGFVLQGKVIREKKTITDPASGELVNLSEGFFMVYDGARQVLFSQAHLDRAVDDREFAPEKSVLNWYVPPSALNQKVVPPIQEITDAPEFDDNWDRIVSFRSMEGRSYAIKQHLGLLSPFYARADAIVNPKSGSTIQYRWNACYLTRELGPAKVRALLQNHKDTKDTPKLTAEERFERRMKIAQFLAQAGWPDHAAVELESMAKDFPAQKEAVESALNNLKKLRSFQTAEALKRAYRGGAYGRFERLLKGFTEEGVPEKTLQDIRALKDEYKTATENVKLAKKYLAALPEDVERAELRALFEEAGKAIAAELTPDNVGRLESFVTQAKQAERLKADKKDPGLAPINLLSLAVSGWTLGNISAESKFDVAQKLWRTRQMVLKYQATSDGPARQQVLDDYLKEKSGVAAIDELAQVVSMLPPPLPEEKIDRTVKEIKTRRVNYQVQVPTEYSHGRPWPILILLSGGGLSPKELIEKWSDAADEHGYILAAPRWEQGVNGTYGYTADEQAIVLETLLDLRRRFNVDSDRVFLFGLASGGNMAFDVGLSHPDLFAGVLPMSALPGGYCFRYRRNAQYLPFYIVNGDKLPDNYLRKFFDEWIPWGYPLLYTQYIGRGMEWFPGEVELALDWMDRKERSNPVAQLALIDKEFRSVRVADNRFYWLSTDSIRTSQLNEDGKYNPNVWGAQLQGSCSKNQVSVRALGVNQVTIWLGRGRRGQNMVEFDKQVVVYVNGTVRTTAKVTPSMKVLLEDLYERGDRQRLYLARIDVDKP